jgi:glycerol-3-phosphate dehydrogenase
VFLIPYEERYTEIGTTDIIVEDPDEPPRISPDEVQYLCAAASRYTLRPVTSDAIVWAWSGVRPLYDDGSSDPSEITRDYHFVLDAEGPPLLSIFGGKLTTFRKLAEAALGRLARWFPNGRPWTATAPLPGGDVGGATFGELVQAYRARYPQLDPRWLERFLHRHGACGADILGDARGERDLGESFGGGLYERELAYLIEREWAREPEDVLWRRTKSGLHMTERERARVAERMMAHA